MSDDDRDKEPSGNGPLYGVLFAIVLTGLTLWLVQKMRDSAAMMDCMFTKDPKCREMIKD